jgi:hypothetical protein
MALAAHCRHLAKSEPDKSVRERLACKALEYDLKASASLMALEIA